MNCFASPRTLQTLSPQRISMRIALAQMNPTVGDLQGNCQRILELARDASSRKAELLIVPELALCGYPPKDLLLRSGFVEACDEAVSRLAAAVPADLGVLVGHPTTWGQPAECAANAASLLHEGKVVATTCKKLLPNYDVFDERRYFRPADSVKPILFRGRKLGVHICEDAWFGQPDTFYHTRPVCESDPVQDLIEAGAELLINLSASPFEVDKSSRRHSILQAHCQRGNIPCVFVNQVGGNDDLVFDGASLLLNRQGQVVTQLAAFEEDLRVIDFHHDMPTEKLQIASRCEQLLQALILGLKDYAAKSGFREAVLGLSGGIDSAVAACLAAYAFGPENVYTLMMPSRYSTQHSIDDSVLLAKNLGIEAIEIPIDEIHTAYEQAPVITADLSSQPAGLADQNLQARIRGAMVMIRSNRHGWLPLATGNKSELAVGYCTLYGDMAGGFAVLCDVLKRDVYAIASHINQKAGREIIPAHIINKPPSAELAPDQFDQDSLPEYDLLDAILEGLVEQEKSANELSIIYPEETVRWVLNKLDRNEFKRRQMPPGIKLTPRAFGSGRRMPMAARYTHFQPE